MLLQNVMALHVMDHVLRAITLRSNNSSNFKRAITFGCDKGSSELDAITFRSKNFSPLC
jgi:hypothetical protein